MTRLLAGLMLLAALFGWSPAARGDDRLTGIVLLTPADGTVVIHHSPFGGMPAMTMTFRLPARVRLHPGDRIRAAVDRAKEPWALAEIQLLGSETAVRRRPEPAFLGAGDAVPGAAFIDQRGRAFSLRALRGRPFALSFIYTRCTDPTMCPLVSAKFRSLQARLAGTAALVEISLDPAYDRPAVLARYSAGFGADPARWHLLTGDPRRVLDFAARFGILEHSAGPSAIVHSERLAVVDAGGRIAKFFDNAAWAPSDVLAALRSQRAPTPPTRSGR